MGLTESLEEFRTLDAAAEAGLLGFPDLANYHAVRDQWTDLLLSAQTIALLPGKHPRRALRAARSLLAGIEFKDGTVRAMTLQVPSGGFAAMLAKGPQVGEEVEVTLSIPSDQPLHASARVVAVKEHLGNASTSFQFVSVDASEAERMEVFVFDAVAILASRAVQGPASAIPRGLVLCASCRTSARARRS